MSSFARAHAAALDAGFANNIRTNLVVAGIWTASFNLGAFSGPTSAGFLVESIGFRGTCFVYVWIYVVVFAVDAAQIIHAKCADRAKKGDANGKYQPL